MYVITLLNSRTRDRKFLRNDSECGNVMDTDRLNSAIMFPTRIEAENEVKRLMDDYNTPQVPYMDGTLCPASFIYRGFEMGNNKISASGVLSIQRIILEPVKNIEVSGKIKKPIGYIYE